MFNNNNISLLIFFFFFPQHKKQGIPYIKPLDLLFFPVEVTSIMIFSRNCLGFISVAYVTLMAMHGSVSAAVINPNGVVHIVNGKTNKILNMNT